MISGILPATVGSDVINNPSFLFSTTINARYPSFCEKTFANYRNNDDFIQVITRIEKTIREQKFTGAAATLLNPNIIARDLGLKDEQTVDQNLTITVRRVKKPPIDER